MKKNLTAVLLTAVIVLSLFSYTGCTNGNSQPAQGENNPGGQQAAEKAEIPTINVCWGHELHTGNMQLNSIKPELFSGNSTYLKPISDSQYELVKDGKTIAYINHVLTKGASESMTLMSQGHLDVAYCSSTAVMTAYDTGVDVSVLGPIQSGGVSIVASVNAPYNTFEELVEYAKKSDKPIVGGYHSAISSPRIVLEYALKEAGLTVTEDTADYSADVVLMDLKGISNLIPSMSSGQVELWAGPVPNPQNAEAQNIGKIIATLDELPGGKWIDFPCCTMNVTTALKEKHPEIVQSLVQVAADVSNFAQNNRQETAELMSGFIGLEPEVLIKNDTTYTTKVTEHFTNGMAIYYDAMSKMGKFSDRLKDKSIDEVMSSVFDFSYTENISN